MREIKDVLPIEMFEQFPGLILDGMMLLLLLRPHALYHEVRVARLDTIPSPSGSKIQQ